MVNRGDDRELFQRSTVRELVVYCCFLVVLIAITFGTTSSVMFYYTQVMGGLFTRAKDVDSVESFWEVCTLLEMSSYLRIIECATMHEGHGQVVTLVTLKIKDPNYLSCHSDCMM